MARDSLPNVFEEWGKGGPELLPLGRHKLTWMGEGWLADPIPRNACLLEKSRDIYSPPDQSSFSSGPREPQPIALSN